MKIRRFMPLFWIVVSTALEVLDRLRPLGPVDSRYLRWRRAAADRKKKRSNGQT